MAFLVSFKGQFKPYTLPDLSAYDRVKKVQTATHSKAVGDQGVSTKLKPDQSEQDFSHQNNAGELSSYNKTKLLSNKHSQRHYARDIMTSPVHCVELGSQLSSVKELMSKYDIRHLPVLDKELLVGIISERDLLRSSHLSVEQVMTSEVLTAYTDVAISDLARIMLHEKFSALPIINTSNKLVGIVTQSDILKFVTTTDSLDALA